MHLREKEGIEGKTFVVTGGLGFVGSALCLELIKRGAHEVRALDLRQSSPSSHILKDNGVKCIQGDVARKEDVERALRGAEYVFHLAAFGMSGKDLLQSSRVDEVNINGTCHVLDACIDLDIKRLVYCSTYNVVFGGQEIVNGNESLPYFPIDHHVDSYGRSKSIAEQLVLQHNARPLKNDTKNRLFTSAVRPAAVYGPGEDRNLRRVITMSRLGLLLFRIGDKSVKTDWVFVDNLVLALILASKGLLEENDGKGKKPVAAGQAYFISDGSPVNSFEFVLPLVKSFDLELPTTSLAVEHALLIGRFFQGVYTIILHPWLNRPSLFPPYTLPSEVHKVGVTHYFSYYKAKEEIGYVPAVTPKEGMDSTISYWKQRKRPTPDRPSIYAWVYCIVAVSLLCGAVILPDTGILSLPGTICLFLFRSTWMTRQVFYNVMVPHVVEAFYAWYLARRIDPAHATGWFWEVVLLGYFSLRFLLKTARNF